MTVTIKQLHEKCLIASQLVMLTFDAQQQNNNAINNLLDQEEKKKTVSCSKLMAEKIYTTKYDKWFLCGVYLSHRNHLSYFVA